jgi:hypothetical protein
LTYDRAEGRWKALQASDIYEQRAYLTEVYRNALAREVRSLSYEIKDLASLHIHQTKAGGYDPALMGRNSD